MNKKRWIAIGMALVLFFIWTLVPSKSSNLDVQKLVSSDKLKETMVEERGGTEKIALLEINGTIAEGSTNSFFPTDAYNHSFFMAQLQAIEKDENVAAIFLEVNSPGGGVYESSEVAKELKKIQAKSKRPFYVSMKNMAASGGYYVAASADKIYAAEETMTGSIGVIMSGLNMSGLLDKLGVSDETVKSGALKDMGSATRKWTQQDRQVLQEMIDGSYDRFVQIVAEGRAIPEAEVRTLADGRIYDGAQAQKVGLVDELGFPEEALAALRKEHHLKNASLIKYELPSTLLASDFANSWLGSRFNSLLGQKESETQLVADLIKGFGSTEAPRMMYLYGGE